MINYHDEFLYGPYQIEIWIFLFHFAQNVKFLLMRNCFIDTRSVASLLAKTYMVYYSLIQYLCNNS